MTENGALKLQVLCILIPGMLFLSCSGDGEYASYPDPNHPALKAQVFAEGFISRANSSERDLSIAPDFSELYFTRDTQIMVSRREGKNWSEPTRASFASSYPELEATCAPDGRTLYFVSKRPLSDTGGAEDWQLWSTTRNDSGWGIPRRLSDRSDFYPSITKTGVMYFTGQDNDIYRTVLLDGSMTERQKLSDSVNTAGPDYNACIAADESYLIFTSFGWGTGYGGGDLFISYRKSDGSWTRAKNMGGGINSRGHEYCPSISPDGKYLFFTSNRTGDEDVYWVDSRVVDLLRKMDLNVPDRLLEAYRNEGVDAVLRRFQTLQNEYFQYCIFTPDILCNVSDRLLSDGDVEGAIKIIRKNIDLYPECQTVPVLLKLALLEKDKTEFSKHAAALKADMGSLDPSMENDLNLLGYRMLFSERISDALLIFRLNMDLFPASANVYDSYAEALAAKGDTEAAIHFYQKSLDLDPDNKNAEKMIAKLETGKHQSK